MPKTQLTPRVGWPSKGWWVGLIGIPAALASVVAVVVPKIIDQPAWIRIGAIVAVPGIVKQASRGYLMSASQIIDKEWWDEVCAKAKTDTSR